jgi:hypothetical protein
LTLIPTARILGVGAGIWIALVIAALLLSGGWPRTAAAWGIAIGIGPLVVVLTDVVGERLVGTSRAASRTTRAAIILLVVVCTIALAVWARASVGFATWWRTNFGG